MLLSVIMVHSISVVLLQPRGSLGYHGAIDKDGSLWAYGAIRFFGSLFPIGTFAYVDSLSSVGAIDMSGSLIPLWYFLIQMVHST
jgi:hypothetical protein